MTKKKHPNITSMNRDTQLMCDGWPRGHGGDREDLNTRILFIRKFSETHIYGSYERDKSQKFHISILYIHNYMQHVLRYHVRNIAGTSTATINPKVSFISPAAWKRLSCRHVSPE